ncbi:S-adenosyl-L-methionine-dependent methyltransferase [Peziza echinospora]|nr:S-adenosyl-L-methionine-dependent methyltransferase [Peziza echinospora]
MAGPIPLAHYMRQCLTSDTGGYYTTPRAPSAASDQFGVHGDFVTSPEISQMFGEMLGIWVLTEWMAQGAASSGVVLVELGPGRGTLMDDILRTIQAFRNMARAVEKVYLVEASPELRDRQRRLLCGEDAVMEEWSGGFRAKSEKYPGYGKPLEIVWFEDVRLLPKFEKRLSPYFIVHEFFDSLPIHAFKATKDGWRELLVSHRDMNIPPAASAEDSVPPPPPSEDPTSTSSTTSTSTQPEFHLVVSPSSTPYSLILPTLSPRFTAVPKDHTATIEVSPEALTYLTTLVTTLSASPHGAILIIDYSATTPETATPSHSLRGIRGHRFVSPFTNPGEIDLSADVDFGLFAETALKVAKNVEVHGPVTQGMFLKMLGMEERARQLVGRVLERAGDEVEKRDRVREIEGAIGRLIGEGEGGMGGVYKVMAIVPERGGRRPVGFGGSVAG